MSQPVFGKHSVEYSSKQFRQDILEKTGGVNLIAVYVDDQEDLLEIVGATLEDYGFSVWTTTSPAAAAEYIRVNKGRIGLILSDYKMPEITGFEFRKMVLESAAEIPFAILSGNIDKEMALVGMELKISTFLEKPMVQARLFDLLVREVNPRIASIFEDMDLLKGFIEDSATLLDNAEETFLFMSENGHSVENLNQVFGMIHTIKGSSGFFEPRTLHKFAHRFEDTLKEAQSGIRLVDANLLSIWLKATDVLKELVTEFKTRNFLDRNLDEMLKVFDVGYADSDTADSQQPAKAAVANAPAAASSIKKQDEIKVSMALLDEFMQISGEMTVVRNMINKVVRSIEKEYPADKDVMLLSDLLDELHKINSLVQTKMTDIRKVPIRNIVKPLNRIVRDVSQKLGKEVDFKVEGEELRIDNALATVLSNSLIHLVRNSLDHGLETTEQRVLAKKPTLGKVKISCVQDADFVVVSIEDDGRGINPEVIAKKVIEKSLKTTEELKTMSKSEIMGMIFAAGFSTAAAITDISGRGVGMSMVKDSVEAVGGKILIESEVGFGSVFKLKLPLPKSVLITNCLFVTVGPHQFGIPQDQVQRILLVNDANKENLIVEVEGARLLRLENQLVPIVKLRDVVRFDNSLKSESEFSLVILEAADSIFALQVEEVLDVEDTVIKHLTTEVTKKVSLFLGATFLGDGSVGLIFDVESMAKTMGLHLKKSYVEAETHFTNKSANVDFQKWLVVKAIVTDEKSGENIDEKYILQQSDVYRIEELKANDLQMAAGMWVIPYRESILALVDLDSLLNHKDPFQFPIGNQGDNSDLFYQVVVIQLKDRFIGIKVDQITDLIETSSPIEPLLNRDPIISGGIIHENEALTVFDVAKLKDKLSSANPQWEIASSTERPALGQANGLNIKQAS